MELKETVELMNSKDYKDRFVAEYLQTKIRYEKLKYMVKKWDKEELNFKPTCPRHLYNVQLKAMADYLIVLEMRATLENIELPKFEGVKTKEENHEDKAEKKEAKKNLSEEEKEKIKEDFAELMFLGLMASLLK